MSATPQSVKDWAPEFAKVDPAKINRFIQYAQLQVNFNHFLNRTDLAVTLITCHLLTLSDRAGAGGAVTEVKIGDEMQVFSLPQGWDAFDTTSYGQLYNALKKGAVRVPPAV